MSQKQLPQLALFLILFCLLNLISPSQTDPQLTLGHSQPSSAHQHLATVEDSSTAEIQNQRRFLIFNRAPLTSSAKTKIIIALIAILALVMVAKILCKRCRRVQLKQTAGNESQIPNQVVREPSPVDQINPEIDQIDDPADSTGVDIDLIKTKYLMTTAASAKTSTIDPTIKYSTERSD